jgi:hypothetical protein
MTEVGKTRAGHKPDIAGSDHGNPHKKSRSEAGIGRLIAL